jgi:hypothetical protein
VNYWQKCMRYHNEFLRRCKISMSDERKDIRICNQHGVDRIMEPVFWETTNNVHHLGQVIMDIPSNAASLSALNATTNNSKGVGKD